MLNTFLSLSQEQKNWKNKNISAGFGYSIMDCFGLFSDLFSVQCSVIIMILRGKGSELSV